MMRIRLGLTTLLMAATAFSGVPAQAETILAQCTGRIGLGQSGSCQVTFNCAQHTIDLRPLPGLDFRGSIQVQVNDGFKVEAHDSTWLTRLVQVTGTEFKTVKMRDYVPCTLRVVANAPRREMYAGGEFGGVVHA